MFPLRMHIELENNDVEEVLVYHFFSNYETGETYGVCWHKSQECWITAPIWTLSPCNDQDTKKQVLLE